MPSIDGESSTSREYSPHMYILSVGGDVANDEDYVFVGSATAAAYHKETGQWYKAGVSVLGQIVCEAETTDGLVTTSCVGVTFESVPDTLRPDMISDALDHIGTVAGNMLLTALGVKLPKGMEPVNFDKWVNGSPQEQAAEEIKRRKWRAIDDQISLSLNLE